MMQADWRTIVVEQLEMLASFDAQLEYDRNVSHVDVSQELVEGWFSDSYHPTDTAFRQCFSHEELEELDEFHATFDRALMALPASQGSMVSWQQTAPWTKVRDQAVRTLQKLLV